MTWLPCGWIYGAEISALAVRNQAAALGSATQYIFNCESPPLASLLVGTKTDLGFFIVLIVEVTPSGISSLGWKFYLPFAVSNAAMIPLLYFFFPEIGMSLFSSPCPSHLLNPLYSQLASLSRVSTRCSRMVL